MNRLILVLSGCLGAVAVCESAPADNFKGRWYLGLGGGVSQLQPDTGDSIYEIAEDQSQSTRLSLGRDLSRRFSLELYLADLGETELKPASTVGYQVGGLHLLTYLYNSDGDAGRFYRDSLAMYIKLGAGGMQNEADGGVEYDRLNDVNFSGGLGLEGLLGWGVSWRAELDSYNSDAVQASLSLLKRFGRTASAKPSAKPSAEREAQQREEEAAELAEVGADVQRAEQPAAVEPVVKESAPRPAIPAAPAPSADGDGDGVRNVDDRCQGTRAGLSVDERGCAFTGIAEGLYFDSGSTELNVAARAILDNIVIELQRYPSVMLEVQAHTDNRGKASANLALSQRRAEQVAGYIISRGIAAKRVRARGFGESRPAYQNATEEGRRRNRRVVFQTVEAVR